MTPSFIGRESERAIIHERLERPDCRLLTIVGAGGSGKTRLAQEIARDLSTPVVFIALDHARSLEQVFATVATALDLIVEIPDETVRSVIASMQASPRLLILDNYEQLCPMSPRFAPCWTARRPHD